MNINLDIPSIISALAVILTAWWKYNQYRHDKLTDLKLERMKHQERERTSQLSYNSGMVLEPYGMCYIRPRPTAYISCSRTP